MTQDDMKAHNQATYGTDDPELIRLMVQTAWEEQQKRENTFGGYLRALRRRREMTETEISLKVGVTKATWMNWEADSQTPSQDELAQVIKHLRLSPIKSERLEQLLSEAPRQKLRNLSLLRLEKMAARGVATFDARLEQESLGTELWKQLLAWAKTKGLNFPGELLSYTRDLNSEEELEAWIDEVLGDDNHAL